MTKVSDAVRCLGSL